MTLRTNQVASTVPGVEPAHITVLGGGVVGSNAAKIAAGFGANVYLGAVAVDQGGCFETARPTTHGGPTYVVDESCTTFGMACAPFAVS